MLIAETEFTASTRTEDWAIEVLSQEGHRMQQREENEEAQVKAGPREPLVLLL